MKIHLLKYCILLFQSWRFKCSWILFLIFDVEQYHFVYDIYYRYQGETSSNVKKVILENPYGESTYSYFLGVLNTLDKTESD